MDLICISYWMLDLQAWQNVMHTHLSCLMVDACWSFGLTPRMCSAENFLVSVLVCLSYFDLWPGSLLELIHISWILCCCVVLCWECRASCFTPWLDPSFLKGVFISPSRHSHLLSFQALKSGSFLLGWPCYGCCHFLFLLSVFTRVLLMIDRVAHWADES